MKSKFRHRLVLQALVLGWTVLSSEVLSQYSSFSNYPSYSTLSSSSGAGSTGGGAQGSPVSTGVGGSGESAKAVDLATNGVGVADHAASMDSQRATQQSPYYSPQGSQNMYYYEMYPREGQRSRQKCTYSSDGMKCQYRRDASVGGGDSYSVAAGSAPSASYGAPMPNTYGMTAYEDDDMMDGGGGGGALGGLSGLIGLIGLKGLKGLKALKPLALALPFIPLLLPLIPIILLPVLLLLLLPILFLPIPVIVVPSARRSLGGGTVSDPEVTYRRLDFSSVSRMARNVLESDQCVERISCEINRASKKYNSSSWVKKLAEYLPKGNRYAKRILTGIEKEADDKSEAKLSSKSGDSIGKNSSGDCTRFACKAKSIIARELIQ